MLMSKTSSNNSIVGEKSEFMGRFMVKGSLRIEGKFEGQALEVEQLFVGPKGKVKSDIYANNVDVEGVIIGNIVANNRVFLRPSSKVLGNIKTKELIIQQGVVLEGSFVIGEDFESSPKESIKKIYEERN